MAKLSEEAKKIIGEIHPGLIATASKDGKPNVSVIFKARTEKK